MNTTFSKLLTLLAIGAALAGCGGGETSPVVESAAAADAMDDLAANAAPNEAVMPPGDPFEAEFPASVQLPNAAS
jgi:hypothetical protein